MISIAIPERVGRYEAFGWKYMPHITSIFTGKFSFLWSFLYQRRVCVRVWDVMSHTRVHKYESSQTSNNFSRHTKSLIACLLCYKVHLLTLRLLSFLLFFFAGKQRKFILRCFSNTYVHVYVHTCRYSIVYSYKREKIPKTCYDLLFDHLHNTHHIIIVDRHVKPSSLLLLYQW